MTKITSALSPEYYGARGCDAEIAHLPIRCYNGVVSGVRDSGHYPFGVFAPSNRIAHRFDGMPEFVDTSHVVLDAGRMCFMLEVDGQYYGSWGSTANKGDLSPWYDSSGRPTEEDIFVRGAVSDVEWNVNGRARTDRLFHDLSGKTTCVATPDGLHDIRAMLPNDYAAIMACLNANGGSMRLASGKTYYCELPKDDAKAFRNFDGFDIDGNGATIILARADKGSVPNGKGGTGNWTWLPMKNCSNGKVHDLTIIAIQDVDSGAPSGHWAFGSLSSGLTAFQLNEGCHDITFERINTHNVNGPLSFRYGRGYAVKDCEFRGMTQMSSSMVNTRFLRCVFEQAPYVGDGTHIVYGMGGENNILFEDCIFRTTSPFTSVMLTHHGSVSGKVPKGIMYLRCTMEGTRIFQGSALAKGDQTQIFCECKLRQTYSTYLYTSGDNNAWGVSSALGIGSGTNVIMERCHIRTASKLLSYDGRPEPLLSVTQCQITGGSSLADLVAGFKGKLTEELNTYSL